jgi:pimeloyl-ACP methyl ester carboxylesterase
MATFLVAHGAWSAGWAWKKMRPLMTARGHDFFVPTQTGIGERRHLARPDTDLEVHIADILAVLDFEDLREVILVGHSYGGMVATGVADRAHERIAQLIYLDAFVPRNGESVADLLGEEGRARSVAVRQAAGVVGQVPPNPMPPDTSEADLAWAVPRGVMQPLGTVEQRLRLTGAVESMPRTYVYCTRAGPGDVFRQFADRARTESGWRYEELDASHNPHITMPDTLMALLERLTGAS